MNFFHRGNYFFKSNELVKTSILTSSTFSKLPFNPKTGFDFSEPLKVPVPKVLKQQFEYSPNIPAPALCIASKTLSACVFGTNTLVYSDLMKDYAGIFDLLVSFFAMLKAYTVTFVKSRLVCAE